MTLGVKLSNCLKKYRYDHRESQADLAKKLKVTRATIIRWEGQGAGATSLDQAEAISKSLGIPVAELLGIAVRASQDVSARPEGTAPDPAESEDQQIREEITSLLPALNHPELLELRSWSRGLARARKFLNNLT